MNLLEPSGQAVPENLSVGALRDESAMLLELLTNPRMSKIEYLRR
jgi:hypothetical protein